MVRRHSDVVTYTWVVSGRAPFHHDFAAGLSLSIFAPEAAAFIVILLADSLGGGPKNEACGKGWQSKMRVQAWTLLAATKILGSLLEKTNRQMLQT